jgi:hypothetical protein
VSYVRFGPLDGLDPSGKSITVEAWVKPQQPGGVILAHGGSQHGYALMLDGAKPQFVVRHEGQLSKVTSPVGLTGDWAHLTGMLTEDRTLKLYLNGQPVAEEHAGSLLTADPKEGLEIGGDEGSPVGPYQSPNGFAGIVDEVRLYYGELTDDEVAARHENSAAAAPTATPLMLAVSFEDGEANDASGNDQNGQIVGAASVPGKRGDGLQFSRRANRAVDSYVQMHWTQDIPLYARAMVLAGDRLFVSGPPDLIDEESTFKHIVEGDDAVARQLARQDAAFKGELGGVLIAVSAGDGATEAKYDIDALPVWNGMAVAEGCLFVATTDGRILSFRGR